MSYLILEDGTIYKGRSFGDVKETIGEVVFNTGMTGYQEVLTDPSYYGQIVCMTFPIIGNCGTNEIDPESEGVHLKGFVMHEICDCPSNWRSSDSLEDYLVKNKICGFDGIDVRSLTQIIRDHGTLRGAITSEEPNEELMKRIKAYEVIRPVNIVTCSNKYDLSTPEAKAGRHIAVMDFGLKKNILRSLLARDCSLTVYPALTSAQEIIQDGCDGIFLTNGPGDPKDNVEIIENVKELFGKKPMFGICLGHQLMALAQGGETVKLKYGHRGCNHPVKDIKKDRMYITSQNHGYTVIAESLGENAQISFVNWNDNTVEGIKYLNMNASSVQFHPEAAPGPKDTAYIFDEFISSL